MTPLASLIIPSYNRPQALAECLEALTRARLTEAEVLVVDDGSPEPLEAVVACYRERLPLRLLRQDNRGPAAARNTGAAAARGHWLVFTDDDCRPDPLWLPTLLAAGRAFPQAILGGTVHNGLPQNPWACASQMVQDYLYSRLNAERQQAQFFSSNNLAVAVPVFQALGGFDPALRTGEDRDFCQRWRERGGQLVYVAEAAVYHCHALTARSFLRQHVGYGRGSWRHYRASAARLTGTAQPAARLQSLRFYLDLLRYPLHNPCAHPRGVMVLLFLLSQVATAAGMLWERSGSFRRVTL